MTDRRVTDFVTEWTDCGDSFEDSGISFVGNHVLETELANQLTSKPGLSFERLVVRRLACNSICLEGIMFSEDEDFDIEDYVKCLPGVQAVINRLTVVKGAPCGEDTCCSGEETVVEW